MKTCIVCKTPKDLSAFYAHPSTADRHSRKCKDCHTSYFRDRRKKYPEKFLFMGARKRARNLGVPFEITEADIKVPECCPVLGVRLTFGNDKLSYSSATIDRIIPSLGYVRGNIIVVSWRANNLKRDATALELRAVADFYSNIANLTNNEPD